MFGENAGYVGTLDPLATGVLPIAIGKARKFIQFVEESQKRYVFTMVFGVTTNTLDSEGNITGKTNCIPNIAKLQSILGDFKGAIQQVPPVFSAIKIKGRRACDRVRHGENVELLPRKVSIFDIHITDEDLRERCAVTLDITCSKGTYVRSIARDIAEKLGSLAYVKALRRVRSGFFSAEDAISLEKLVGIRDIRELIDVLLPIESPLDDIPALYLRKEDVVRLQSGVLVAFEHGIGSSSNVKIFDDFLGDFYGVAFASEDGFLKPVRMLVRS
jgi:tRNA pseudouridine55 synthase